MPGTIDSVMFFSPWMAWPITGSTPTICTPGHHRFRKRPVPISVPVVPMPATK